MDEILVTCNYIYNAYGVSHLLAGVFIFLIGNFIIANNNKSKENISFFVMTLCATVWMFAAGMAFSAIDQSISFFWHKISFIGAVLITPTFYLFTIFAVNSSQKIFKLIAIYAASTVFLAALAADLLITNPKIMFGIYIASPGPFHAALILFIFVTIAITSAELIFSIKNSKTTKIKQKQLEYILFTFLIASASSINFLSIYNLPVPPLGLIFLVAWGLMISRAITRFKFFFLTPELAAMTVFETINDALIVTDTFGRITLANASAVSLLGINLKEIEGAHISTFIKYADFPASEEIMTLKNATIFESKEVSAQTKAGGFIPILISANIIKNSKGAPIGIASIARDIRKLKLSESEIRRTNRALETISEISRHMARSTNEGEFLTSVCEAIVKTGGYNFAWIGFAQYDDKKTVLPVASFGLGDFDISTLKITWGNDEFGSGPTGTAIKTGRYSIVRDVINDPRTKTWSKEAKKQDGKSGISLPIFKNNSVIGSFSIYSSDKDAFNEQEIQLLGKLAEDVSFGINFFREKDEKEHAQKQLKESEQKYKSYVEQSTDGIFVMKDNGEILDTNKAGEDITGISAKELRGMNLRDIMSSQDKTKEQKLNFLLDLVKNSKNQTTLTIKKDGGNNTIVDLRAVHLSPDQNLGFVRDITERELAIKKLRDLDLMKSRFITTLTHVSRTPLNEIRWNVESLLGGEFGNLGSEQKTFLRRALESEGAVLRLIQNMNMVLNLERGALFLDKQPASIQSMAASVNNTFTEECNLRGIKCSQEGDGASMPLVNIDPEKIRMVMEIMLDNAIRYTGENGKITLSIRKSQGDVKFSVSDTGIGIPQAEQIHIFELFFRATNAQLAHPNGVGIGLSIAKSIIEAHKGKIGFTSGEGKGSEFWFSLPCVE
ncbi:MAG: multi-sensor hybrid histidine kinase [uncultured bacterium]|nr:MAG: multi-sensor hybrid histidine kinase [uncultured bacterium]HBD05089.1 hypothetical protein [Candidatus Uhrbacteria bacterium]